MMLGVLDEKQPLIKTREKNWISASFASLSALMACINDHADKDISKIYYSACIEKACFFSRRICFDKRSQKICGNDKIGCGKGKEKTGKAN